MFEGDSVQLICEFVGDNFNLFDNPVVWHKTQRLHHYGSDGDEIYNESSQINMMASVREPFSATKRFKPSFHSSPPTFRFALLITGIITLPRTSLLGTLVARDANVINNDKLTLNELLLQ